VKVFNWTATLWRGSLSFEPPMLFALSFLFLFTIGGFSGVMLAIVPVTSSTTKPTSCRSLSLCAGAGRSSAIKARVWLPEIAPAPAHSEVSDHE